MRPAPPPERSPQNSYRTIWSGKEPDVSGSIPSYDENARPLVTLYQYDGTGTQRKAVPLDKSSLSITKKASQ